MKLKTASPSHNDLWPCLPTTCFRLWMALNPRNGRLQPTPSHSASLRIVLILRAIYTRVCQAVSPFHVTYESFLFPMRAAYPTRLVLLHNTLMILYDKGHKASVYATFQAFVLQEWGNRNKTSGYPVARSRFEPGTPGYKECMRPTYSTATFNALFNFIALVLKLTVTQMVKKSPFFYKTWRIAIVFTTA